jgi:hypothetical protein
VWAFVCSTVLLAAGIALGVVADCYRRGGLEPADPREARYERLSTLALVGALACLVVSVRGR